jgi:hypothetical protein
VQCALAFNIGRHRRVECPPVPNFKDLISGLSCEDKDYCVACHSTWTLVRSALVSLSHAVTVLPGISFTIYLYWNVRIAVGIQFSVAAVMLFQDSALRPWEEFQSRTVKPVRIVVLINDVNRVYAGPGGRAVCGEGLVLVVEIAGSNSAWDSDVCRVSQERGLETS